MMEKYGAEKSKYEVLEVNPSQPDDKKVVASNMDLEDALELVGRDKNFIVYPMN